MIGGPVSYAAVTAQRLGWDVAILTAAGPDFEPGRDLPGARVVSRASPSTTSFRNIYSGNGSRRQLVSSRADEIDLSLLPEALREPEALLLGPVVGEIPPASAEAFGAGFVGAEGQGWLREIDTNGQVSASEWREPARDLAGVHALVVSPGDLPPGGRPAQDYLGFVPMVAFTRGRQGLDLMTRDATHPVPSLPRDEVDPTGAGDVFTAAFLIRYSETQDAPKAAAFAACAASSSVEGWGTSSIGDRTEVERRLDLRERLIEEGAIDG